MPQSTETVTAPGRAFESPTYVIGTQLHPQSAINYFDQLWDANGPETGYEIYSSGFGWSAHPQSQELVIPHPGAGTFTVARREYIPPRTRYSRAQEIHTLLTPPDHVGTFNLLARLTNGHMPSDGVVGDRDYISVASPLGELSLPVYYDEDDERHQYDQDQNRQRQLLSAIMRSVVERFEPLID